MPTSLHVRQGSKDRSRVLVLLLAATAIVINMVCLGLGVRCLTTINSETSAQSSEFVGTIACVKCEDSSLYPVVDKLSKRSGDGSEELCCAESSAQMTALLELTLSKPVSRVSRQEQVSPEHEFTDGSLNFSLSEASAHKRVMSREKFDSKKDKVPVFKMITLIMNTTRLEVQEHVRGVQVLESGYSITHKGLYHVYSNIKFKPDTDRSCGSFDFQVWEQLVLRIPTSGPEETILKSVHTCGKTTVGDQETSYTGGTFNLEIGDKLQINISGLGLAYFNAESSYFGLAMLGDRKYS